MFFRFGSAVLLVVVVSLTGIGLEKQNLEFRRLLSRQQYRADVLLESHSRLRLRTQQLGAPVRLIDSLEDGSLEVRQPEKPLVSRPRRFPLLRWQRSAPRSH